jgi:dTDP-4-dehydrorhamnose reductase
MKTLILGDTGRLGSAFKEYLRVNKKKYFIIKRKKNLLKDFKNILKKKPDLVINCIAETNVDLCNQNLLLALKTNTELVKNFINIMIKLKYKKKFIHISTDQIYNSEDSRIKNKENNIKLSNNYSISKYLGELEAKKYKNTIIVRTNFFGKSLTSRPSYSDYIIRKLKFGKINAPSNVYFNPIHVNELVEKIILLSKKTNKGIFNIGSSSFISKYQFVKRIAKLYNLNVKDVISFKSSYLVNKRPLGTIMNLEKLQKALKDKTSKINNSILRLKKYKI